MDPVQPCDLLVNISAPVLDIGTSSSINISGKGPPKEALPII